MYISVRECKNRVIDISISHMIINYYTRTANRSDLTYQHAYNKERFASFLNNALAVNAFQTQHHYFNQHHHIVSSIESTRLSFFSFCLFLSLSCLSFRLILIIMSLSFIFFLLRGFSVSLAFSLMHDSRIEQKHEHGPNSNMWRGSCGTW